MRYFFFLSFFVIIFNLQAQQNPCMGLTPDFKTHLEQDLKYLTAENMAGGNPGRSMELMTNYLESAFKKMDLKGMTANNYRQSFNINLEVNRGKVNSLKIKKLKEKLDTDYFPVQYSSNAHLKAKTIYVGYGIEAPEKQYNDYADIKAKKLKGRVFVMDISTPDGMAPGSAYYLYQDLGDRIALAKEKGAAGVILINTQNKTEDLQPVFKELKSSSIPVVFLKNAETIERVKKGTKVEMTTSLIQKSLEATNVFGMLNNEAGSTIIISAHYTVPTGAVTMDEKEHKKQNQDAVNIAGLLEIARTIAANREEFKEHNFVFAVFPGVDDGLEGSSYFVNTLSKDELHKYFGMIDLNLQDNLNVPVIKISGENSSSLWIDLIKSIYCDNLNVNETEDNSGLFDQANFYYHQIPAINISTVHKEGPGSADRQKGLALEYESNYLRYVVTLAKRMEKVKWTKFVPYAEKDLGPQHPSLEIIPEVFAKGFVVEYLTTGGPAYMAGLQKGDTILRIGDTPVNDAESYVKALQQYRGERLIPVIYLRNGKKYNVTIHF